MPTGNAASLQSNKDAHRAARTAKDPKDAVEGRTGNATFTGNASLTTFDVNHGLPYAPTKVLITPTTLVAGAQHAVTVKDATKFTVSYAAAPAAGANNIKFDWLAI